MSNVLDGEWAQPAPERQIKVELSVSESLARSGALESGALARLLGEDAARTITELLAKEDLEKVSNRLEEIETVSRREKRLQEAQEAHENGEGFHPGFPPAEDGRDDRTNRG